MRRNVRCTVLPVDGPLPAAMVRDALAIRRDPLQYLERVVAAYGDLVAFPLPRTPVLLVNDPVGVRRVLVENPSGYVKRTVQYGALSAVTGGGLLTADGAGWRASRRRMQPAFHHGRLDVVAEQSVAAARQLVSGWPADGAPGPQVLDVDAACMRATLRVVGRTLFGADLAEDGERIVAAVQDALEVVVQRARTPRPGWLPLPSARRLARAVATLDEGCARVLAARRARGVAAGDDDLLALLLAADGPDGELTPQQVRDELVTLVIAGHETVASSLAWTFQLLAEHPEVQQRLHAELDVVLGPPSAGRDPGWSDLPALAYTRQVVDEALRLFPPAWVLSRRATAPDLVAGVPVPAGTLVIISPWLLHRRAAGWPDPLAFDPDRFAGRPAAAPRPDYLPFGIGPRLCIGRDFALVESVLTLATVLREFAVAPVLRDGRPHRPRIDAVVTLRPAGGMPLAVRRRGRSGPGALA